MVELLYITTDDNMPVGTVREIYPFSQVIEIPDMEEPLELELDCGIEQLCGSHAGSGKYPDKGSRASGALGTLKAAGK